MKSIDKYIVCFVQMTFFFSTVCLFFFFAFFHCQIFSGDENRSSGTTFSLPHSLSQQGEDSLLQWGMMLAELWAWFVYRCSWILKKKFPLFLGAEHFHMIDLCFMKWIFCVNLQVFYHRFSFWTFSMVNYIGW